MLYVKVFLLLLIGVDAMAISPAGSHGLSALRDAPAAGIIMPPFYHSTEAIDDELRMLQTKCPSMSVGTKQMTGKDGRSVAINAVYIRAPGATPKNRMFMMYGEHPRELISPESGLHLVQTLCGQHEHLKAAAEKVLEDSEFLIVVNGNPQSRVKVEAGDYCLRANPHNVDLNRDWDAHWETGSHGRGDTPSGDRPFSQLETRIFKAFAEEFKPTSYLSVHSGNLGMYMPWAYNQDGPVPSPAMMGILAQLDQHYCQCPYGAAGVEVQYSCPGSSLDWMYDTAKAAYAFAWEIYIDTAMQSDLRQRWEEKINSEEGQRRHANDTLAHPHFKGLFEDYPSSFIHLASEGDPFREMGSTNDECFRYYNPMTERDYKTVTDNWSRAYLDLAGLVSSDLLKAEPSADTEAASPNASGIDPAHSWGEVLRAALPLAGIILGLSCCCFLCARSIRTP